MPKQTLLLILIFALTACAQPTPAPTVTPLPPTATLMPSPTFTPSPTATPIPTIEDILPADLYQRVYDLPLKLSQDGQQIVNTMTNEVFFTLQNGEWAWEHGDYNLNREIDNFMEEENYVPPEALVHYKGDYWRWLWAEVVPEVEEWFQAHQEQIIPPEEMPWIEASDGTMRQKRFFDEDFDPEQLPFNSKWTFHHTEDNGYLHEIIPTFGFNPETGKVESVWVGSIRITPYMRERPPYIINANKTWMEKMGVGIFSSQPRDAGGNIYPMVEEEWAEAEKVSAANQQTQTEGGVGGDGDGDEIKARMSRFKEGDLSALDGFLVSSFSLRHEYINF